MLKIFTKMYSLIICNCIVENLLSERKVMSSTAENEINPNDEDCLDTLNLVDKAIVTRDQHALFCQLLSSPD